MSGIGMWFSILIAAVATANAQLENCHGYDGWDYPNNTVCPGSKTCCDPKATCLSIGLCHDPNDGADTFVRGPCLLDPYDPDQCSNMCPYEGETGRLPRVTRCQDGLLCCDNDDNCCSEGRGRYLNNNGEFADEPPSTTYSWGPERTEEGFVAEGLDTTTSASQTPSSTSNSDEDGESDEDNGDTEDGGSVENDSNDNSMKIGLGVGIPVGCVLIAAGALWLFWRRRRAPKQAAGPHEVNDENHTKAPVFGQVWGSYQGLQQPVEMESPQQNDQGPNYVQQHDGRRRSFAEMAG